MPEHVRLTREHFESVVVTVERALAAGRMGVLIPWGPAELAVETRADGSLSLRLPGEEAPLSLYVRPEIRPKEYPEDLPFLPDQFVTVGSSGGQVAATWWVPSDPGAAADTVHRHSIDAGWALAHESPVGSGGSFSRLYTRRGRRRILAATDGALTLVESTERS